MLIKIGIEAFKLVALLMGLWVMMGIGISGTDEMGASGSEFLRHFFQMSVPVRKTASEIRIITAGVKVQ